DMARRVPPGVEVLRLRQAGRLDQRPQVRSVVRHSDAGRRVEAFHQHAYFTLGVEDERAADRRPSLAPRPRRGRIEESTRDRGIILAVKETEEGDPLFLRPLLVEVGIDL